MRLSEAEKFYSVKGTFDLPGAEKFCLCRESANGRCSERGGSRSPGTAHSANGRRAAKGQARRHGQDNQAGAGGCSPRCAGGPGAPPVRSNEALLTPLTTEKGCPTQPWLADTPHLATRSGQGKIERNKAFGRRTDKKARGLSPEKCRRLHSPAGPKSFSSLILKRESPADFPARLSLLDCGAFRYINALIA